MPRTAAIFAAIFAIISLVTASPARPAQATGVEREIIVPAGWEGAYDFGYAPVIRVGDRVIVSGIPAGGDGTYEEKIRGMYRRAVELLTAAGATIDDVVELTTFHSEPEDSAAFGAEFERYMPIHKEFFGEHRPAWTAVGTPALLSSTAPVEMRVIAVIGSGKANRVVYEDPPPASAADTDTATGIDDPSSAPTEEPKPASSSLGLQLELAVPQAPTPFPSGGEMHLVYELHLTSFDRDDIALRRIEVMAADETAARPLAAFEGEELISVLRPIGAAGATESRDPRALPPGGRVIAYLWITLDAATPVPRRLRHRVVASTAEVEGGTVATSGDQPPVLGAPLAGAGWLAANGPGNDSRHRRAVTALDGRTQIAQRYAIDWVQLGDDGGTFSGDRGDNASYHAYGDEVLAVADGTVAAVKDSIPENIPGPSSRAVPITRETIGGNYVILDLGDGLFAFYAHLQPGSLRVREGDRVRRGQVLALLGNSGNSTEPHLHFHLADGPSPLAAEGVPFVIDEYSTLDSNGDPERRTAELPLENARVDF